MIKFCFKHNNIPCSKELPKFTWFRSPIPSRLKEVDTVVLESMVGVPNDAIEKITQMLTKQEEMLLQLGSRLSCLEEGRGKKPLQDKDKIAVETAMMMEKMQQIFCKAQGMDVFLYTMGGLGLIPLVPLPP